MMEEWAVCWARSVPPNLYGRPATPPPLSLQMRLQRAGGLEPQAPLGVQPSLPMLAPFGPGRCLCREPLLQAPEPLQLDTAGGARIKAGLLSWLPQGQASWACMPSGPYESQCFSWAPGAS